MSNARLASKVIGATVAAGGALAAGSSSVVSTSLPDEQEVACSRLEAWQRGGSDPDQRGDGSIASTDDGGGKLVMSGQRHLNLRLRDASHEDGDVEGDLTAALSNLARSEQGRSVMEMGINIARDEPFQREMMDRLGIGPEALQKVGCSSSSTVSAAEGDQSLLMIQTRTIDHSSRTSNHHHLLMEIESLRSRLRDQAVEHTEKDERIQDLDELVQHLMLQNDRLMDRIDELKGDSTTSQGDESIDEHNDEIRRTLMSLRPRSTRHTDSTAPSGLPKPKTYLDYACVVAAAIIAIVAVRFGARPRF